MLGRFSMHYPSFRNSVLFWVMIVLLLSFLIFFRRFFFKLRILVVTSSCFWTRGNKMVWLICFKVFFIILLHDWNPHTEMAWVICDINLLVTRKLVFQKIMWCYFGCFFFNVILFDVVYLYADIFVLRCAPRKEFQDIIQCCLLNWIVIYMYFVLITKITIVLYLHKMCALIG